MLNIDDYNNIIDNSVKIETGSYVGTGTYGSSTPNILTVPESAKIAFVFYPNSRYKGIFVKGCYAYSEGSVEGDFEWNGTTLKWYSDNQSYQLNSSGTTYYWVAIG